MDCTQYSQNTLEYSTPNLVEGCKRTHKVLTFSPKETRRYSPDGCRDTARGASSKKLINSEDLSWKFQTRRALSMPTVATFRQYHNEVDSTGLASIRPTATDKIISTTACVPKRSEDVGTSFNRSFNPCHKRCTPKVTRVRQHSPAVSKLLPRRR